MRTEGLVLLFFLALPSVTACSAGLGPAMNRSIEHGATDAGARATGIVPLRRDGGVALGAEVETAWRVDEVEGYGPDHRRVAFLAGYEAVPLPHRPAVGFEALAAFGFGTHAHEETSARAWSLGARFGLPIRVRRGRPIWNVDEKVDATGAFVPTLDGRAVFPMGDVDHGVRFEVGVGLAYRLHIWTGLLP